MLTLCLQPCKQIDEEVVEAEEVEATPEMGGTCDIHQSMHLIREVAVTETEGDLLVWMGLSRLVAFQNPGGLSLWLKKDQ